ncbi:CcdB family protein [Caulobacter sp.]|uniref:CcdB family protein n=1 Tax=Caulobacter sp. TaxID=78 RepID=UPI003BA8B9E1
MRQFDAYLNPSATSRDIAPYLVVLSSHHLRDLTDVIVAPAISDATRAVGVVELLVELDGRPLVLVISDLFSVSSDQLRRRAGSLLPHEDEIRRALDRLFTGF